MLASSPLNDDHNVIREPDEARLVPAITLPAGSGSLHARGCCRGRISLRRIGSSCQGGCRTPAFRLTAGRLAVRLPGIVYRCAPWASNPVLSGVRARCPTSQAWRAQIGVFQWAGRESNPLCRQDGWFTASCAPWRDRPNSGTRWRWPQTNDAYAVVKVLLSGAGARRARPEGVEPPAGGFGDRGATMARAQGV